MPHILSLISCIQQQHSTNELSSEHKTETLPSNTTQQGNIRHLNKQQFV